MSSGLFEYYEVRPPACQAVSVWFDTIDDIAKYFAGSGRFTTTLTKREGFIRLQVKWEGNDSHQPVDLDMILDRKAPGCDWDTREVLVRYAYVDPLTPEFVLVPAQQFTEAWRRVDPFTMVPVPSS